MYTFYVFLYFRSAISFALRYSHLFSKKFRHHRPRSSVITDTTDRYGPIIVVSGVGGDFSHTHFTVIVSVYGTHSNDGMCGTVAVADISKKLFKEFFEYSQEDWLNSVLFNCEQKMCAQSIKFHVYNCDITFHLCAFVSLPSYVHHTL